MSTKSIDEETSNLTYQYCDASSQISLPETAIESTRVTCEECHIAWLVPWHKPSHHNLLRDIFHKPLQQRYAYVEMRALGGCDFSLIILKSLRSIGIDGSTGSLSHFWEQDAANNVSVLHIHVFREIHSENGMRTRKEQWEVYAGDRCYYFDLQPLPHIPDHPFGKDNYDQLRRWIHDCRDSHPLCTSSVSAEAPLPTRVINVGSNLEGQNPYLYVSKGEFGPYTTLSYRWGDRLNYKTTAQNVVQLQQEIVFDDIPATFQQAIAITRALGIQYLWIDAICIIQDDISDWEQESGRMASIYGNSYLTISATSSLCPADGIAPVRSSPKTFKHKNDDDETFTVFVRPLLEHNFLESNTFLSSEYPTLGRGWCFQERYLSSRVVHFLKEEIVWECQEKRLCQCGGIERRPDQTKAHYQDLVRRIHKAQNDETRVGKLAADEIFQILEGWTIVLGDFCRTTLTHDTDILPALSGIAKSLQQAGLGQYLAGLWRFRLEDQLTWHSRSDLSGNCGRRPTPSTAPTFSPLSRIGDISFNYHNSSKPVRQHATVLDAVSILKGSDVTGAVTSGYIRLQGPLLSAHVELNRHVEHRNAGWHITCRAN